MSVEEEPVPTVSTKNPEHWFIVCHACGLEGIYPWTWREVVLQYLCEECYEAWRAMRAMSAPAPRRAR